MFKNIKQSKVIGHFWNFFSTVNLKSLFRKEALYQKFKEQGKSVIQQVRSQLHEKFLTMLKISEVSKYIFS